MNPKEQEKQLAAKMALAFVQDGMRLGLGTGTTIKYFIEYLGPLLKDKGWQIEGVPTSERTKQLALSHGIPLDCSLDFKTVDLTVDGADEISPEKQMIKGGGGALLYEKLLMEASKKVVIVADSTKSVPVLGAFPLPVEIIPFGYQHTLDRLKEAGFSPVLRMVNDCPLFTDGGHYLADLVNTGPIRHPEQMHLTIKAISGVVETGLFCDYVDHVCIPTHLFS